MDGSYHHGSLRETLLAEGRRLLVEDGLEAVTLRELARRAGVSHAAPNRHFADREALLEAIRSRGFEELAGLLTRAAEDDDPRGRLATYARGSVAFAIENGPLAALMFSKKPAAQQDTDDPAARFFALGARLLGEPASGSLSTTPYLVAAMFEGIATLAAADRIPPGDLDGLIDAAVDLLLPTVQAGLQRPADCSSATAATTPGGPPSPDTRNEAERAEGT